MVVAAVDEENGPNKLTKKTIDTPVPNAQTILVIPGTSTNASLAVNASYDAAEAVIGAIATQSSDAVDAIQLVSSPNTGTGALGDVAASNLDLYNDENEVQSGLSTSRDTIVPACHISVGQRDVSMVSIENVNVNVVGSACITAPDVSINSTVPTSGETSTARNFNVRVVIDPLSAQQMSKYTGAKKVRGSSDENDVPVRRRTSRKTKETQKFNNSFVRCCVCRKNFLIDSQIQALGSNIVCSSRCLYKNVA